MGFGDGQAVTHRLNAEKVGKVKKGGIRAEAGEGGCCGVRTAGA